MRKLFACVTILLILGVVVSAKNLKKGSALIPPPPPNSQAPGSQPVAVSGTQGGVPTPNSAPSGGQINGTPPPPPPIGGQALQPVGGQTSGVVGGLSGVPTNGSSVSPLPNNGQPQSGTLAPPPNTTGGQAFQPVGGQTSGVIGGLSGVPTNGSSNSLPNNAQPQSGAQAPPGSTGNQISGSQGPPIGSQASGVVGGLSGVPTNGSTVTTLATAGQAPPVSKLLLSKRINSKKH